MGFHSPLLPLLHILCTIYALALLSKEPTKRPPTIARMPRSCTGSGQTSLFFRWHHHRITFHCPFFNCRTCVTKMLFVACSHGIVYCQYTFSQYPSCAGHPPLSFTIHFSTQQDLYLRYTRELDNRINRSIYYKQDVSRFPTAWST